MGRPREATTGRPQGGEAKGRPEGGQREATGRPPQNATGRPEGGQREARGRPALRPSRSHIHDPYIIIIF